MKIFQLVLSSALAAAFAAPALAQGLPPVQSSSGNPLNVPGTTAAPVGAAVVKGGDVVSAASGAHGSGPAPIVSGGVPQAEGFADGVTDGTEKIGHGAQATGRSIERHGITVNPQGAEGGLNSAPKGLTRQAGQLQSAARPGL